MADQKLVELVKQLYKRTRAKKVHWESTVEPGLFLASFPGYSVQISFHDNRNDPETTDYILQIFDDEGLLIEEVADIDFEDEDFLPLSAFETMSRTYSLARRQALGVDKALDTLLSELKE